MAHERAPVDDTDIEAVGLLAFSALVAMTRLTKDGDQAPDVKAHIEHTRMPARAFELFEQLETWAERCGCDLHEAIGQYSSLYDDLDTRARPSTWSERSVKTYVTLDIIGDLLRGVNERHGLFNTSPNVWDLNQGDWEYNHLTPQIGEDSQLAARLSLWAHRVTGEILGPVRTTLLAHPALVKKPDATDEITVLVTRRHDERMAQINLKA